MKEKSVPEKIISLGQEHILFRTETSTSSPHTMHAVKLCIPIEGALTITCQGKSPESAKAPIIIRANTLHTLSCEGHSLTLLLAPELLMHLDIQWNPQRPFFWLSGRQREDLFALARSQSFYLPSSELADMAKDWVDCLSFGNKEKSWDGRILEVQQRLKYCIQTGEGKLSLDALAAEVGLSSYRLSHLFREQTGCTFQRYILWQKLLFTVPFFASGCSISQVAHMAGFSDHAHLSRTAKKLIGRTPTEIMKNSKIIQDKS